MKTGELVRRALLTSSSCMILAAMATPGCGPFSTEPASEVTAFDKATSITIAAVPAATGPHAIGAPPRVFLPIDQDGTELQAQKFTWTMRIISSPGGGQVATLAGSAVTCVSLGRVEITASAKNSSRTLQASTTVDCGSRALVITSEPPNKSLVAGASFTYRAEGREPDGTLLPGAGSYTWTSSDPTVFSLPAGPLVGIGATGQALKAGVVTISVTSPAIPGSTTTTTLRVTAPFVTIITTSLPAAPTDDPTNAKIPLGIGGQRQFALNDQLGRAVTTGTTWSTNAAGVATISNSGMALCISGGSVTVTGTAIASGLSATTTLNCLSIVIAPNPATVRVDEDLTLTATVLGATSAVDVNWTPTITANLTVTKLSPTTASVRGRAATGTTPVTITATVVQGGTTFSNTRDVTVLPTLVPTFTVIPSLLSLSPAESKGLTTTTLNVTGSSTITWQSKDANIATVVVNGATGATVTGSNKLFRDATTYVVGTLTAGSLTLKDSTLVLVSSSPVEISPNPPAAVAAGGTQQFTLRTMSGTVSTGVVPNEEIIWSSSSSVATIDANGLARCSSTSATGGTATITGTVRPPIGAFQRTASTTLTCQGAAPAPGFSLSPATVSVVQGAAAVPASLTVTRTGGFTGAMGVSTSYTPPGSTTPGPLPAGLSLLPTATTFSGNAITFNVSATSAVPAGTYPITVTTSSGLAPQSTTLTVVVSGATAATQVTRVILDPAGLELTVPNNLNSLGSFQYVAHLFNAAGAEIAVESGGTLTVNSANLNVLNVNPTAAGQVPQGAALPGAPGTTTVTATYSRNGTTITSAASSVEVYANSVGLYSSVAVQFVGSTTPYPSALRQLKVGQSVDFDLIIRDKSGASVPFKADQAIGFTLSSNAIAVSARQTTSTTNTLRYTLTANSLPGTSVIAGVPNVVTLQVDIEGAMVKIPIMIVP